VLAASLLARQGALDEGRARLAQGLGLALQAGSPVLALNAAMTGGELALLANDHAEADAHFDLVARIAARLGRGAVVAHALVRRAAVFFATGDRAKALAAFACAATAARDTRAHEVERDALAGLASLYRAAGMHLEADAAERRRLASETLAESTAAHCAHRHVP
jgi:tetratricopeptide (TPR) repeat protein